MTMTDIPISNKRQYITGIRISPKHYFLKRELLTKMADRTKISAAHSKNATKPKRPSTVTATSSRTKLVPKEKIVRGKKPSANATALEADTTILNTEFHGFPEFDTEKYQIAYGEILRAMLEDCVFDEAVEREETVMDLQMSQLADRFQKTVELLDKTNRRLKDMSFEVEQKRLCDLKSSTNNEFIKATEESDAATILNTLNTTEQAYLDRIELNNVDFGYDKTSGHKQLLDAVNDAIEGLDQIKKEYHLDVSNFKEFDKNQTSIEELEKDRFDVESLRADFDAKFPQFSEQLLKEATERIAKLIESDEADDNDGDDD
ncbi:hypothetical protein B5X24_HaOG212412 [Helicoverpa armigera]|uniref:Uncharacterized protein n=1 Tax=Helicoverpa armigera TaxID=29058 RepID=A0A2W1B9B9_HELAM|nr:hypothetical protein B5X24_HaOG212412 [Helicoverpa armigera]